MNIVCFIGARGGSKGVQGKNIRLLLGKPLIAWTIEQALQCKQINDVIVSTDSLLIADVAKAYGAKVPFIRPFELATDSAGKWQVWQHALSFYENFYGKKVDLFVDLDCTAPLREVDDISNAIAQYFASDVDGIFSVCQARKNPYFNMIEIVDGYQRISKSASRQIVCRQDAPKVYEHVASIYVLSPEYVRNGTGLLSGRTLGYDIGAAKSIDIDSEFDFEFVEYLMRKRQESAHSNTKYEGSE